MLHHVGRMIGSAFELVTLKGGACSILSRVHGETMHIGSDPCTEAFELHIRQQGLIKRVGEWTRPDPFVIWDIGLGPAGNAIAAIEALREIGRPLEIHSFEISTEVLEFALHHAGRLGYLSGWEPVVMQLLTEGEAYPSPLIRWQLHHGDFSREKITAPIPSAIFFDPYSPAQNPEMWNIATFRSIWSAVSGADAPPCTMTNYTRSTSVRVTMALAGWFVGVGVPTGEKSETTIAANRIGLLEKPLDRCWLKRVRASTNAAPIRGGYERWAISSADFDSLGGLSQFLVES